MHKPSKKLRIYPDKKGLGRGTSLCKDTPVGEGKYGGPEKQRDDQLGYNMQCGMKVEVSLTMLARATSCV